MAFLAVMAEKTSAKPGEGPPLAFNSALKLPDRAPTKTRLHISIDMQLHAWAHQQLTYAQLSPLYLLSTLNVTHINYSRPSTTFPYRK